MSKETRKAELLERAMQIMELHGKGSLEKIRDHHRSEAKKLSDKGKNHFSQRSASVAGQANGGDRSKTSKYQIQQTREKRVKGRSTAHAASANVADKLIKRRDK